MILECWDSEPDKRPNMDQIVDILKQKPLLIDNYEFGPSLKSDTTGSIEQLHSQLSQNSDTNVLRGILDEVSMSEERVGNNNVDEKGQKLSKYPKVVRKLSRLFRGTWERD